MRRLIDRAFDGLAGSRVITAEGMNTITFPHRADLWRPAPLAVGPDKEAVDVSYVISKRSVLCLFSATPEREQADMEGRTKVTNIFTDDKFFFPMGTAVEDTWCIKLVKAGVDDVGRFWMVQGNPQPQEGFAFQLTSVQMVYGKTSPPPAGVS